jgi:hypothetical protein
LTDGLAWPPSKEDLERLYLEQRLSAAKIAEAYGLKSANPKSSETLVLYYLRKHGIKRRDKAEHIRKVTEQMVDEWVKRYEAGESLKQIAGSEVDSVTVWNHLKSSGVVLRDKVEAQIKAVTEHPRRKFEGSRSDIAYLCGFAMGDCHVVRHGRAVRVRTSTTHPAMADLFESLFGRYGFVHRYPRKAKLVPFEWSLEVDLDESFGFLLSSRETIIEECTGSLELMFSFLAGLIDAEGTIYYHRKGMNGGFEIYLTNKDTFLLGRVQRCLESIDIFTKLETRMQIPERMAEGKKETISRLVIWRDRDVESVLRMLQVRHGEKRRKRELALEIMNRRDLSRRERILAWDELLDSIKLERDQFVESAGEALADRRSGVASS